MSGVRPRLHRKRRLPAPNRRFPPRELGLSGFVELYVREFCRLNHLIYP